MGRAEDAKLQCSALETRYNMAHYKVKLCTEQIHLKPRYVFWYHLNIYEETSAYTLSEMLLKKA